MSRFKKLLWGQAYPQEVSVEVVGRAMVIAPHPDDEAIGMGGVLVQLAASTNVVLVYLTDGQQGIPGLSGDAAGAVRRREASEMAQYLGVESVEFMGLPDSDVSLSPQTVEALWNLLEKYQPDDVFVPFFYDSHPDHAVTAQVLAKALIQYKRDVCCWCYEVWSPLVPSHVVDISSNMDEKIKLIQFHRSQIAVIDYAEKIRGLNAYRSITLAGASYAEAYLRLSRHDYIKLAVGLGCPYVLSLFITVQPILGSISGSGML